jgi:hypothetical protein
MKRVESFGCAAIALLAWASPGWPTAAAAAPTCDPYLLRLAAQIPDNAVRYAFRGDRCEGTFSRQVAGQPLQLVSFTTAFENVDALDGPVSVEWHAPLAAETVHIQASPLASRFGYRMDTERPATASPYVWPMDVMRHLGLSRTNLAVRGWTSANVDGFMRDVHLPLKISQKEHRAAHPPSHELLLWPHAELAALRVTVTQSGNGRVAWEWDRKSRLLPRREIRISFRAATDPGFFRVSVGARVQPHGEPASLEFWYYQAEHE